MSARAFMNPAHRDGEIVDSLDRGDTDGVREEDGVERCEIGEAHRRAP